MSTLIRFPAEFSVSPTRLMEKLRCEWRYNLRYGMNIQPLMPSMPMQLGTLVHAGTEALLLGAKRPHKAIKEKIEPYLDKIREHLSELDELMAQTVMDEAIDMRDRLAPHLAFRAAQWFDANHWKPETVQIGKKQVILVEHRFSVKIADTEVWMQPDFVMVNTETGVRAVWDLKVRQSSAGFIAPEVLDTDVQTAFYQYGLVEEYSLETHGSGILSLLAKEPEEPKRTQKGALSRAIDQYPRADVYRQAMAEDGISLHDPDYQNILSVLDNRKWEEGILHHRSDKDIDEIVKTVMRQVMEADGHLEPHRNIGSFECRRCWARDACLGTLRGEDIDHMITDLEPGMTVEIQGVDFQPVEVTGADEESK